MTIQGGARLTGIDYDLTVASAQVKSAILLAGLYAEGETTVREHAVTRDHTERMLRAFGVDVRSAPGRVSLTGGGELKATYLRVPGDVSSAAFFLVAGALAAEGPFLMRDVGMNPTRTGIIEILKLMGADLRILNPRLAGDEPVADVEVHAAPLHGIEVPPALVPLAIDEFPVLFIAAACARGTTLVTGAAELRVKESDRIAAMAEGLHALGIRAEALPDGMRIEGGTLGGGRVREPRRPPHRDGLRDRGAARRTRRSSSRTSPTSRPRSRASRRSPATPGSRSKRAVESGPGHRDRRTVAAPARARSAGGSRTPSAGTCSIRGALYRLVGLAGSQAGLDTADEAGHAALAARMEVRFGTGPDGEERVLAGRRGRDARRSAPSWPATSPPRWRAYPAVRAALVGRQRRFAEPPGLVADGRDMGTVVFPGAVLKVFLTASAEERAREAA